MFLIYKSIQKNFKIIISKQFILERFGYKIKVIIQTDFDHLCVFHYKKVNLQSILVSEINNIVKLMKKYLSNTRYTAII